MAQTKTKSKSKPKSSQSKSKRPKPKQAKKAVAAKAKPSSNGSAINGKAKLPLIAGGAALVGAAGVAFGAAKSGSKVLGVKLPQAKRVQFRSKDISKAAKQVGHFGEQVGDLTEELRSLRKGVAG